MTNPKENNLENLYKSALKFLEPMSLDATYHKIVMEAIKIAGADFGSLFIREKGKLERVYAHPQSLHKNKIRKHGFTYRASLKKGPSVVNIGQIEKSHPAVKDMGIKATIYVPLINKNKRIGLLAIDFVEEKDFSREVDILKIFTSVAGLAIRKAQLYNDVNRALEERDLFISLASHELRTPLTIVLLYSDLIEKSILKNKIPDEKWAKLVVREAHRLKLMTDEFLSADQIRSGQLKYTFTQTELSKLVKRAIQNFSATHKNNPVTFTEETKGAKDILADYDKLIQVITNILNNASKYSPKNTQIKIVLKDTTRELLLKISDEGVGISKKDLDKIFEKYYQSKNTKREGFGLGLYLSRIIMEMHKGSIEAKSQLTKGTEITLRLPKFNPSSKEKSKRTQVIT